MEPDNNKQSGVDAEKKKKALMQTPSLCAEVHNNAGLQTTSLGCYGDVVEAAKIHCLLSKTKLWWSCESSGDGRSHVSHTEWTTVPEIEAAVWPQVISPLVLHKNGPEMEQKIK